MRKRLVHFLFFVVGLALFAYLVSEFGIDQIIENIRRAGWSLLWIILIWLAIYVLNTLAWRLVLGESGGELTIPSLFAITVSGFVINYMTPLVALGGEPYRVKALSGTLGLQRSVSVVVLYRMVHLLGHMMLLLVGALAALLILPLPPSAAGMLGVSVVVISGTVAVILAGNRKGVFGRLVNFIDRFRVFRVFSDRLLKYDAEISEMDAVLTKVYHTARPKFYLAVMLEFLGRALMGLEVYVILQGIGMETGLMQAMFLYVVYSIVINILFFVPWNLGAREGGLVLGMETLALAPVLGVSLGVIIRLREFFWILVGLLLIPITGKRGRNNNGPLEERQ